jgi:hypothetical protein
VTCGKENNWSGTVSKTEALPADECQIRSGHWLSENTSAQNVASHRMTRYRNSREPSKRRRTVFVTEIDPQVRCISFLMSFIEIDRSTAIMLGFACLWRLQLDDTLAMYFVPRYAPCSFMLAFSRVHFLKQEANEIGTIFVDCGKIFDLRICGDLNSSGR